MHWFLSPIVERTKTVVDENDVEHYATAKVPKIDDYVDEWNTSKGFDRGRNLALTFTENVTQAQFDAADADPQILFIAETVENYADVAAGKRPPQAGPLPVPRRQQLREFAASIGVTVTLPDGADQRDIVQWLREVVVNG